MLAGWSIRWRLTAWYVGTLFLILVIFGVTMHLMIRNHLYRQLDDELAEEASELVEGLGKSTGNASNRFDGSYSEHGRFSFRIDKPDGTVVRGSPWVRIHPIPLPGAADDSQKTRIQDLHFGKLGPHRVLTRCLRSDAGPQFLHVIAPELKVEQDVRSFSSILLVAGMLALLAACVGGSTITRQALHPVERITCAAERISAENCGELVAVENPHDELGRLAATLNRTFERLRDSLDQMSRFTADAAHELRTPLAVLRMECDVALRSDLDPDSARQSMMLIVEEIDRLSRIVDQLLTLSRLDVQAPLPASEEIYISPLVHDVAELLETTAQSKCVSLEVGKIPDRIVHGDDVALSRLLFNLVDNAIKYTPAGGRVRVDGCVQHDRLTITVADTGIGIDRRHWEHLFDRFYRVDGSRNAKTGGAGLGLAICKAIADAHGANLSVQSVWGQGSTFSLTIPVSTARESSIGESEHSWEMQHAMAT